MKPNTVPFTGIPANPMNPRSSNRKHDSLCLEQIAWVDFQDEYMRRQMDLVRKVSKTNASVLIVGESGVGKKTFAKIIHKLSKKSERIEYCNLESISPDHHYKAVYSILVHAHDTTLVIDKIHLFNKEQQVELNALLRQHVLNNKPCRIIATSPVNLSTMVQKGQFHKELYYRLNVMRFELPRLSERASDIIPLAEYFLAQIDETKSLRLTHDAKKLIFKYSWPGNLNELRNIIQRSKILSTSYEIDSSCIEIEKKKQKSDDWIAALPIGLSMKNVETHFILETLKHHQGNRTHCAKTLGISLRTLRNKINEYQALGLEVMEPTKGKALA